MKKEMECIDKFDVNKFTRMSFPKVDYPDMYFFVFVVQASWDAFIVQATKVRLPLQLKSCEEGKKKLGFPRSRVSLVTLDRR